MACKSYFFNVNGCLFLCVHIFIYSTYHFLSSLKSHSQQSQTAVASKCDISKSETIATSICQIVCQTHFIRYDFTSLDYNYIFQRNPPPLVILVKRRYYIYCAKEYHSMMNNYSLLSNTYILYHITNYCTLSI